MVGIVGRSLAGFRVVAACAVSLGELRLRAEVEGLVERLVSVASEAAGGLDAEQHEQIRSPEDASAPSFKSQRRELRRVQAAYRHLLQGTDVYTLRRSSAAVGVEAVGPLVVVVVHSVRALARVPPLGGFGRRGAGRQGDGQRERRERGESRQSHSSSRQCLDWNAVRRGKIADETHSCGDRPAEPS